MSYKAFVPSTPLRLLDLLQVKANQKQDKLSDIAISQDLFLMKTSLAETKCQIAFDIINYAIKTLEIKAKDVTCLITGEDSFTFWPLVMEKSKMSIKEATQIEGLAEAKQFTSSAHAISVALIQALGGEFKPQIYKFRDFRNAAEEVGAFVLIGDDLSVVQKKINKAFCEEKTENDVLNQFEIFEQLEGQIAIGDEKLTFYQLKEKFLQGEITAKSLKECLVQQYGKYIISNPEVKEMTTKFSAKK